MKAYAWEYVSCRQLTKHADLIELMMPYADGISQTCFAVYNGILISADKSSHYLCLSYIFVYGSPGCMSSMLKYAGNKSLPTALFAKHAFQPKSC